MSFDARSRPPAGSPPRSRGAAEHACAAQLQALLRRLPAELPPARAARFPLLSALSSAEGSPTDLDCSPHSVTRALLVVATQVHPEADERRTAEYLLRHRGAVIEGKRSPSRLLFAARFAAEMDCRRIHRTEIPFAGADTASTDTLAPAPRAQDASVPEVVVGFLQQALGIAVLPEFAADSVGTAVTIALEVSGRHHARNGRAPSVIAMRPDARRDARLITHLRAELGPSAAVDQLSRMLTGADGSPIDTSLLWWAAQGVDSTVRVPATVRSQWARAMSALVNHGRPISATHGCDRGTDALGGVSVHAI